MSKELIERVAKELERHDMQAYGWSATLFEVWWTKDKRSISSRRKQRSRARKLLKLGLLNASSS